MIVNTFNVFVSTGLYKNKKQQYGLKLHSLSHDKLELSFKGIHPTEEYQKLAIDLISKFPEHIKQRIIPKIKQTIVADTIKDAVKSDVITNDYNIYEQLPQHLMDLSDAIREILPPPFLEIIDSIVRDQKTFETLPQGKSPLLIEGNEEIATTEAEPITISVNSGGKQIVLPQEITDVLIIVRNLDLSKNQQEAFLRSLTGAADESELKGFAKVDESKEVGKIDEAEKNGKFAAVAHGEDNYTLYISTNKGTADFKDVQNSIAKSLAIIIIKDFALEYQKGIKEAYARDIRVHDLHRAINDKLKGKNVDEFESLREMKDLLTALPALANDSSSKIGIERAMEDIITDMFMETNRHDLEDKQLISLMYPALSKSIKKELAVEEQKLIETSGSNDLKPIQ